MQIQYRRSGPSWKIQVKMTGLMFLLMVTHYVYFNDGRDTMTNVIVIVVGPKKKRKVEIVPVRVITRRGGDSDGAFPFSIRSGH